MAIQSQLIFKESIKVKSYCRNILECESSGLDFFLPAVMAPFHIRSDFIHPMWTNEIEPVPSRTGELFMREDGSTVKVTEDWDNGRIQTGVFTGRFRVGNKVEQTGKTDHEKNEDLSFRMQKVWASPFFKIERIAVVHHRGQRHSTKTWVHYRDVNEKDFMPNTKRNEPMTKLLYCTINGVEAFVPIAALKYEDRSPRR